MKIFIIDFSSDNKIELKIPQDIEIYKESIDGGQAYKIIGEIVPDLILVNCRAKPSHCLQTALAVKQRKKTSHIPILFIDNIGKYNEKIAKIGECISYEGIEKYIQSFRNISR